MVLLLVSMPLGVVALRVLVSIAIYEFIHKAVGVLTFIVLLYLFVFSKGVPSLVLVSRLLLIGVLIVLIFVLLFVVHLLFKP